MYVCMLHSLLKAYSKISDSGPVDKSHALNCSSYRNRTFEKQTDTLDNRHRVYPQKTVGCINCLELRTIKHCKIMQMISRFKVYYSDSPSSLTILAICLYICPLEIADSASPRLHPFILKKNWCVLLVNLHSKDNLFITDLSPIISVYT